MLIILNVRQYVNIFLAKSDISSEIMKKVTLREGSREFSKLVKAVEDGGERFLLTRHGKPIAVISPPEIDRDDPSWRAAYEEMCRLLDEGMDLGGLRVNRDDLYDRV